MSLSSLIVQREVATMRQVEEALARQVIYGGDLVTNLLEVAQVDESVLIGLLAESMHIAPAPAGELREASERVTALVPREMAIERGVVPLEVRGDGKLILAVAEPLSHDVVEQLRVALGMGIEQRAAPAVRVQQAVSRAYGVPLERRMLRLIARLAGAPPEPGSSLPPLVGAPSVPSPRPRSSPPASRMTGPSFGGAVAVVGRLAPRTASRRVTTSTGFPAIRVPLEPAPAPRPRSAPPPASSEPLEPRAGLLQRDHVPGPRPGRRRRGPVTVDVAKQEAEEAEDRDTLLDLFFDFSQQFFDYAALFLVHGDIAEGRDAFGAGVTRERVLGIGVPLDLPSMMSTVRDQRAPLVAKPVADGLDGVLLADLNRGSDSETAMVPLVVRTRAVAILIGDCGEAGIERESVQQVAAFSAIVGKAFERIIVRRKLGGFIAGASESAAGRVPSAKVGIKTRPGTSPGESPRVSDVAQAQVASEAVAPLTRPEPALPAPTVAAAAPASASSAPMAAAAAPASASSAPVEAPAPPSQWVRSVPSESKPPERAARSSVSPGVPPPAANIAAVRKISGAPIPREEPDAPATLPIAIEPLRAVSSRAVSVRPVSSPDLEVELSVEETDASSSLFDEIGLTASEPAASAFPPSASISVPPHLPPAPGPASVELPSVIVDDLERELRSMVDRVVAGEADQFAEGELLRQGERAMPAIMSRFPGPVAFARTRIATTVSPPRASDCGPVLRLVARERRVALPFVLERLSSADPEVRGWATHLLCELPYVDAIPPLVSRLRDADASICVSAGQALVAIARTSPDRVRQAIVALAHGTAVNDRVVAMTMMAKLRDGAVVPELVRALGDADDRVIDSAHGALVQITRQDHGTDARHWLRWWEQHAAKHRIEWLIDALVHEVAEIRKNASEELRSLTKEYFGYTGDLPPRERERAQQRYRDWWTIEGRSRFRQP